MFSNIRGSFVLAWSQTYVDGLGMAPVSALSIGATWRWSGSATRVDGADDRLVLDGAPGVAALRERAAKTVRKMMHGRVANGNRLSDLDDAEPLFERSFSMTDGRRVFSATLIDVATSARPLVMFADGLPPSDTDLWITRCPDGLGALRLSKAVDNVMCFTRGTWLDTPAGRKQVEALRPGDLVATMDDGAQPVRWIGTRTISGARLQSFPDLRPVSIKTGAFGASHPQPDLLLSPRHRVLVRGAAARNLFNTPEVLVAASDLLNDGSIRRVTPPRGVTYIHLMFDRHQVVWANGILSETFHPASADLGALEAAERDALLSLCPELSNSAYAYGSTARRSLSAAEAAVMVHGTRH
ncbi:MAG: hemolysin-type calcium-binding protein [Rhodobacteraceae bacterium]|nr:hemolysin-type calcium-binding protein [Paracoccaceae bacterium]